MHLVIWTYEVMEGKTRQDLLAVINATAPEYQNVPGLIRKYYALGTGLRTVMEFYLWESRAAADKFFNWEWDGETTRRWESARMTREDFEVPKVVEGVHGTVAMEA